VTGAGFALTVKVLPDPPTGRTTENVNLRGLTPRHDPYGKLMGIAGIDEWGKSEECCNATPDPYDAERALRPLVIFRKVCLGSRSRTGSENVTIFSSLVETTKLQKGTVIELFQALFGGNATEAHAQIFPDQT